MPSWYSCSGLAPAGRWRPTRPCPLAAASAAATVVRHGTRCTFAAARMCAPSARAPRPRGEFTTRSTLPDEMRSTASWPVPLADLGDHRRRRERRCASRCAAVPEVATIVNPSSTKRRAASTPAALSRSASDRKIVPVSGSGLPAAIWLLANARPKRAVDAHDLAGRAHLGAEHGVDLGEAVEREHRLLHARVARRRRRAQQALGAQLGERGADHHPGRRPSPAARRSPWPRTAPCGSPAGWPRSRTPGPAFTAYCTLIRPRTSSASAIARGVLPRCTSMTVRGQRVAAGARRRSRPSARRPPRRAPSRRRSAPRRCASRMASTSTSIASSRKRSIEHGPLGRQPSLASEASRSRRARPSRRRARRRRRRSAWPGRRARSDGRTSTG